MAVSLTPVDLHQPCSINSKGSNCHCGLRCMRNLYPRLGQPVLCKSAGLRPPSRRKHWERWRTALGMACASQPVCSTCSSLSLWMAKSLQQTNLSTLFRCWQMRSARWLQLKPLLGFDHSLSASAPTSVQQSIPTLCFCFLYFSMRLQLMVVVVVVPAVQALAWLNRMWRRLLLQQQSRSPPLRRQCPHLQLQLRGDNFKPWGLLLMFWPWKGEHIIVPKLTPKMEPQDFKGFVPGVGCIWKIPT